MFLLINDIVNDILKRSAVYLLCSLVDVSSIPPTAAWENLQKQIRLQIQNQAETISYSEQEIQDWMLPSSMLSSFLTCQFVCA